MTEREKKKKEKGFKNMPRSGTECHLFSQLALRLLPGFKVSSRFVSLILFLCLYALALSFLQLQHTATGSLSLSDHV